MSTLAALAIRCHSLIWRSARSICRCHSRVENRRLAAGHAHEYDIKGLVLDGVFIVYQDGNPATYRAGEVFAVPAGKSHTEEIGPNGARIVVGRKY